MFLLSILLMGALGLLGLVLLESRLERWVDARLTEELLEKAHTIAVAIPTSSEAPDAMADAMGEALNGRVTLINADGVVTGDSARTDVERAAMGNHGTRPEVLAARAMGIGIARRFSDTLQEEMLYVAVSAEGGVVRLAVERSELAVLKEDLRGLLLLSLLFGVGLSATLSLLTSRWVSRDVQDLIAQAQHMVESGSGRLVLSGRPDLLFLVRAFNQLAAAREGTVRDLAVERDRLGSVLEGLGEAVIALDESQRITLVNPAAVSLFSFSESPHDLVLTELIPDDALAAFIGTVIGAESKTTEFSLPASPGPGRQILITATPQRRGGGCLLVCRDVTNLRRLERIRRDFVANVSHELRTPVAIVRLNAETLLGGALSDPIHGPRFVDGIYRNAERLSRLLTDLLDLSQLEAGRYQLSAASYSLAPAAAQALSQVQHKAEERNQDITLRVPTDLRARFDLPALEQVLTNLLDNAVKYCPPGSQIVLKASRTGA
ncbi:MAG: two-component system phosphate regulon sensor histidine kinase PhoR, partial [Myxococcota bacterium]